MKNDALPESYFDGTVEPTGLSVFDVGTGLDSLALRSDRMGTRLATRAHVNILRSASQEVLHDKCRALLACTAMENAMMLSALEVTCYRAAPFGEHRYKQIADAYAASAAARIRRW